MKFKFLAGIAVLALIGAGVSSAAIPDSTTGVITACRANGQLRMIDKQAGVNCYAWEAQLQWNTQGPIGATGPAGAIGPQGPAGAGASFEQVVAKGWEASQPFGLWTKSLYCPEGKKAIAAYGNASSASSYGGMGWDTLALAIDNNGSADPSGLVVFSVVKVSGMPPYVLFDVRITCVTASLVS